MRVVYLGSGLTSASIGSLPFGRVPTWHKLNQQWARISRYIVVDEGQDVLGEGISHARRANREGAIDDALLEMKPEAAESYRLRR